MPASDRRVLRILGVLMLGFAASTTFLFWLRPNMMLVPVGYWFDDRSLLAVWAWVAALDSILLVAALVLLGTSSPGRVGIGVAVVAAACLPLAFAVHTRLPHNLIPEYQVALSGMERVIPQLQRQGPEQVRTRCEWGAWSGNKPAYVTRRYGLTDGTRDDTMKAIVRFFEAKGYIPEVQPRRWHRYLRGPDTTIDIVSDDHPTEPRATFKVRLERQSCSVFE